MRVKIGRDQGKDSSCEGKLGRHQNAKDMLAREQREDGIV